jgi:homoserine dehydrogenase
LSSGLPLVTANKAMIAAHGLELARLAEANDAPLVFEAAVGGGIPVIKALREGLAGNAIRRVCGILNGTCNYILSRMETDGLPFEVCLADAQKLGYAEADPSFDIGGFDSAHKLAILASLAFGAKIDADGVSVEGIESITLADIAAADELGYRVKLLGVAERTQKGVEQRVHPTMVAKSEPLAQTMGVLNAVTIDGDALGALTLVGAGAGGDATASAVAADIADIARGHRGPAFGRPVDALEDAERVPMQRHEGGYYVRLAVVDRPGSMATIAMRMGERKISLEAIMQKRPLKGAPSSEIAPVVLITHATTEASIREALALAVADGVVTEKPQVIRIERA